MVLLRVRVCVVAPLISVYVVPPSVLTCHWNPVPAATAVKLALEPAHTVVFTGCDVMLATLLTVSVAFEEIMLLLQLLLITT